MIERTTKVYGAYFGRGAHVRMSSEAGASGEGGGSSESAAAADAVAGDADSEEAADDSGGEGDSDSAADSADQSAAADAKPRVKESKGEDKTSAIEARLAELADKVTVQEQQLALARTKARKTALKELKVDPDYWDLVPDYDVLDPKGERKLEDWVKKRPKLLAGAGAAAPTEAADAARKTNSRTERMIGRHLKD